MKINFKKIILILSFLVVLFATTSFANEMNGNVDNTNFLKNSENSMLYIVENSKTERKISSFDLVDNKFYFTSSDVGTYEIYILVGKKKVTPIVRSSDGTKLSSGYDKNDEVSERHKVLKNGTNYYIELTQEQIDSGVTFVTEHTSSNEYTENDFYVGSAKKEEPDTLFESIEKISSDFILSLSKTINYLLCGALNQTITLDDIIFNTYSETKLEFFESDLDGFDKKTDSSLILSLRSAVNTWYSNFKAIALVGYMILLLYVGLKILMSSTTAKATAKYKETFTTWVMGIVILMFFPYVMKYIIILNDTFVKYIADSRDVIPINATLDSSLDQGFLYTDYDNVIDFESGTDYMSKIGNMANHAGKIGFSLTYAILTWQLVMMVVYYFKRVFIIAFLIIIFPLVVLMYVWDKLNDGKAQSLSIWLREFSMSVFVQTFHAIVYVFVVNVIYSTLDSNSYDFILLMIASSFMFAGENILKSIFGGGGESLGSVPQTAKKIGFVTALATNVGGRVIKNVVSKDGFVRSQIRAVGEVRKFGLLYKKDSNGVRNIDKLVTNQAAELRMNKFLPAEGEITPTTRKTAEVIDTFNNLDKKKPEEIAKAREDFEKLMQKRQDGSMTMDERKQFDAMMKHSKITMNQMERLNKAMGNAAIAYSLAENSKTDKKRIVQNLQVEVEVILNSKDPSKITPKDISRNTNNFVRAGFIEMKKRGNSGIKREDVRKEVENKVVSVANVYDNIKLSDKVSSGATKNGANHSTKSGGVTTNKKDRAQSIADQYKKRIGKKDFDPATENMINTFSEKLAVMEEFGVNTVNVNEALDTISTIPTSKEARRIFNDMSKFAKLQSDVDTLTYMVAKKASTDSTLAVNTQQKFESVAQTIENNASKIKVNATSKHVDVNSDNMNNVSVDPFVSIIDIINAVNTNGGNVSDFNDMMNSASDSSVIDQIVANKMTDIRKENQERIMDSQDFADYALKIINRETAGYEYEEATYMGYTKDDVKELRNAAIGDLFTNAASTLADAVAIPAGVTIGAVVGAANTTDGMPLGESIGGATSGAMAATNIADKIIPNVTNEKQRTKAKSSIEKKVKKRIEKDENTILKAKNEFENAQYDNRGNADTYLTLDGFTANLIVDANDNLTAILHIMAKNAEYVCVNEQPGAGNWQSFQENISYTFRDGDYKKSHSLYVYVKDASGNIKNSVQYNLKP